MENGYESLPAAIRAALKAPPEVQTSAQPKRAEAAPTAGSATDTERAGRYAAAVPAAGEGQRNATAYALAFKLAELFRLSGAEILDACRDWNARCVPPLSEAELAATVRSATTRASREGKTGAKWTPPHTKAAPRASDPAPQRMTADEIENQLQHIENLSGKEKEEAAEDLIGRAAPTLARLPALKQERLTERLRETLQVGRRPFGRALKQAQRRAAGEDDEAAEGHPDYQELAREYLHSRNLGEPGTEIRIRYFRQDFYPWNGRFWEATPEDDIKTDVTAFLQTQSKIAHRVSEGLVGNVMRNLKGLARIPHDVDPPFWIETGTPAPRLIPLENGILDPDALFEGRADALRPCTPHLFNAFALATSYTLEAKAPNFEKFLAEALPSEDVRRHIMEWFGLNLTYDTRYQKFLILIGKGADGKSTFLTAMLALLGSAASAVNLSAFGAERTFNLAPTINKLANVCPDIDYTTSREEGLLKGFVDGAPLSIERKGRDPRTVTPTARLSFSTNRFPSFKDRSGALYRRLLLVHFPNSVPEERQNPDLCTVNYWARELPGILNLALEGLKRLDARGRFQDPEECRVLKTEHQIEQNPAVEFLRDHCQPCPCHQNATPPTKKNPCTRHSTWAGDLYDAYREWMQKSGNVKAQLDKAHFGREVVQTFPSVGLTKHTRRHVIYRKQLMGGLLTVTDEIETASRDRQWLGLIYTPPSQPDADDQAPEPTTDEAPTAETERTNPPPHVDLDSERIPI